MTTAVEYVRAHDGSYVKLRVLLDGGSQLNFISEKAAKMLKLPKEKMNVPVDGVHGNTVIMKEAVNTAIMSAMSENSEPLVSVCMLIKELPGLHPAIKLDKSKLKLPDCSRLADPNFDKPLKVDMLLGSDITYRTLLNGNIVLGENSPVVQKKIFGYVVVGSFLVSDLAPSIKHTYFVSAHLDDLLRKFW